MGNNKRERKGKLETKSVKLSKPDASTLESAAAWWGLPVSELIRDVVMPLCNLSETERKLLQAAAKAQAHRGPGRIMSSLLTTRLASMKAKNFVWGGDMYFPSDLVVDFAGNTVTEDPASRYHTAFIHELEIEVIRRVAFLRSVDEREGLPDAERAWLIAHAETADRSLKRMTAAASGEYARSFEQSSKEPLM